MNIIIAGCGNIGTSVLASLVAEGHNVTVIDKDSKIIETASTAFDTMGVVGNAADSDALPRPVLVPATFLCRSQVRMSSIC